MKTYVLTLSEVFPTNHARAGEPTGFRENLRKTKIHTIRANYEFWRKRFDKIDAGEAVLSIRQWVGKPYGKDSTQRELCRLTCEDGIGIERLMFDKSLLLPHVNYKPVGIGNLANNDGLSLDDWKEWFKHCDLKKPLAVIHFTKFRYK